MKDMSDDTPDQVRYNGETFYQRTVTSKVSVYNGRVVRQAFQRAKVVGSKDFDMWQEEQEAWWQDRCPGFILECVPPQPGEGW